MVQTFFRVVTPQEALRLLLQVPPVTTERVPTVRARGRVLAEDLYSAVDLPHFHRAAMDGYAVKAKDTFGASQSLPAYLKLAGVMEMGKEAARPVATAKPTKAAMQARPTLDHQDRLARYAADGLATTESPGCVSSGVRQWSVAPRLREREIPSGCICILSAGW